MSEIIELFNNIDNIINDNDKNDVFVKKIMDKVYVLFKSHLSYKRKKEEKAREAMLKSYREYLIGFYEIITKQVEIIDNMINEEFTSDCSEVFIDLQKELDEYSMKKYNIQFWFMSNFMNKKECDIYKNIQIYSFIDKYYDSISERDAILVGEKGKEEVADRSSDWKYYYYLYEKTKRV